MTFFELSRRQAGLAMMLCLVSMSALGCSQDDEISGVIVEGIVKVSGTPTGGMDIELACGDNGYAALSTVKEDGTFKTPHKLPPGEYRVAFLKSEKPGHQGDGPPPLLPMPKVIPKKNRDMSTTDLRVQVTMESAGTPIVIEM